MAVLYLDTNHLSRLVRDADHPTVRRVLGALRDGRTHLAVSMLHLHELSHPQFRSRADVGALLDSLPLTWAIQLPDVWDGETERAFRIALTESAPPLRVFDADPRRSLGMPDEAVIPPSQMLEAMAEHPHLRAYTTETAEYGARYDGLLKTRAAAIRNPEEPILARLRDMKRNRSPSGLYLPQAYPETEILRRAGGLAALPGYQVFQELGRTRLADERYETDLNDMIDEWHACYSPYADLTALDRRTIGRMRSARLPSLARATSDLTDVATWLDRL